MNKLVIRLRRKGSSRKPMFDIVVTLAQKRNYANFFERLGYYSPSEARFLFINFQRLGFWLNKGAQLNVAVKKCIANFGISKGRK